MTTSYIYKITNKETGKIYIGKTKHCIYRRMVGHFDDAQRQGRSSQRKILQAIREYGEKAFVIEVVEEVPEEVDIFERERHYIKLFNSVNTGYNMIGDERRKTHTITETHNASSRDAKTDLCLDVITIIQKELKTSFDDTYTQFTEKQMEQLYQTLQNIPKETFVKVGQKIRFYPTASNNIIYTKLFLNKLFECIHNTSFDVKSEKSWKTKVDGITRRGRTYTYGFI